MQTDECHWTDWLNDYDQQVLFSHNNMVVAGVQSEHNNGAEDRRFKYYLCKLSIGKFHYIR